MLPLNRVKLADPSNKAEEIKFTVFILRSIAYVITRLIIETINTVATQKKEEILI